MHGGGYLVTEYDVDFCKPSKLIEDCSRSVWECQECGRLAISTNAGMLQWYEPRTDNVSKNRFLCFPDKPEAKS